MPENQRAFRNTGDYRKLRFEMTEKQESELDPSAAGYLESLTREIIGCSLEKGQVFRILDLEGNQAVDTLFWRK